MQFVYKMREQVGKSYKQLLKGSLIRVMLYYHLISAHVWKYAFGEDLGVSEAQRVSKSIFPQEGWDKVVLPTLRV